MLPSVNWGACSQTIIDAAGTSDVIPTFQCLPVVFDLILNAAILCTGVVSFFLIMLAGMKYIRSRGDPKELDEAKKTIVYVIVGMTVIFLSFLLLNIIAHITGVSCMISFGLGVCL